MSTNDRYTVACTAQMLPAMLHALAIARNSAMLGRGKGVEAEFQAMLDGLAAQAGVPDLLRTVDEYAWYAAADALKVSREFHWHTKEGHRKVWDDPSSQAPGEVTLVVDGREFRIGRDVMDDNPHIAGIMDLLERYAGVEAVKGPPVAHWRSHTDMEAANRPRPDHEPAAPVAWPLVHLHDEDVDLMDGESFDGDDESDDPEQDRFDP